MKIPNPAIALTQLLYAQSVLSGLIPNPGALPPRRAWPLMAGGGTALLPLVEMGRSLPQSAAAPASCFKPAAAPDMSALCDSVDEGARKYFVLQERLLKSGASTNTSHCDSGAGADYRRRFKVLYREGASARARAAAALGEDTMAEDDPVEHPADADLRRFEERAATIDTFFARIRQARDFLFARIEVAAPAAQRAGLRAYALEVLDTQVDRARSPLSQASMAAPIFYPDLHHLEGKLRGFIQRQNTSQARGQETRDQAQAAQGIDDVNRFYADGTHNIMGPHQRAGFPNLAELQLLARDGVVTFTGPNARDNALRFGPRAHRSQAADNRSAKWKYGPQELVDRDPDHRIPIKGVRFESSDRKIHQMRPFSRYLQLEMQGDRYRIDQGPWMANPYPENRQVEMAKYQRIRELMKSAARQVLQIQQTGASHDPRDLTGAGWFFDFLRRHDVPLPWDRG